MEAMISGGSSDSRSTSTSNPSQNANLANDFRKLHYLDHRAKKIGLMTNHPILSNVITQNMAKRHVQLMGIVEALALRNVEGRVAHYLLSDSVGNPIQNNRSGNQSSYI
jgi:CRP-like cAMP-binding protein